MNLPRPLNNNVLVEIVDPHQAVSRNDEGESRKKGRIIDYSVSKYHLTASAAIEFSDDFINAKKDELALLVKSSSYVYWEEFANEGQESKHGDKTYASVAWWRLISSIELEEK